jgi:hypothetical protein
MSRGFNLAENAGWRQQNDHGPLPLEISNVAVAGIQQFPAVDSPTSPVLSTGQNTPGSNARIPRNVDRESFMGGSAIEFSPPTTANPATSEWPATVDRPVRGRSQSTMSTPKVVVDLAHARKLSAQSLPTDTPGLAHLSASITFAPESGDNDWHTDVRHSSPGGTDPDKRAQLIAMTSIGSASKVERLDNGLTPGEEALRRFNANNHKRVWERDRGRVERAVFTYRALVAVTGIAGALLACAQHELLVQGYAPDSTAMLLCKVPPPLRELSLMHLLATSPCSASVARLHANLGCHCCKNFLGPLEGWRLSQHACVSLCCSARWRASCSRSSR